MRELSDHGMEQGHDWAHLRVGYLVCRHHCAGGLCLPVSRVLPQEAQAVLQVVRGCKGLLDLDLAGGIIYALACSPLACSTCSLKSQTQPLQACVGTHSLRVNDQSLCQSTAALLPCVASMSCGAGDRRWSRGKFRCHLGSTRTPQARWQMLAPCTPAGTEAAHRCPPCPVLAAAQPAP